MEVVVRWGGLPAARSETTRGSEMLFVAETGSGHLMTMDGAPEGGGNDLAPRPMETLLAGTAGCSAYDVVLILRRSRQDVRGCEVRVAGERADADPRVFVSLAFHYIVRGRALKASVVERAIKLSHDKYCSATAMLAKTATVAHSYEVIED